MNHYYQKVLLIKETKFIVSYISFPKEKSSNFRPILWAFDRRNARILPVITKLKHSKGNRRRSIGSAKNFLPLAIIWLLHHGGNQTQPQSNMSTKYMSKEGEGVAKLR